MLEKYIIMIDFIRSFIVGFLLMYGLIEGVKCYLQNYIDNNRIPIEKQE